MYEVVRVDGKVMGARRLSDGTSFPLVATNRHARDFMEWNAQQPEPLDLLDQPGKPKRTRDEKLADLRKLKPEEREALLLELLADRME